VGAGLRERRWRRCCLLALALVFSVLVLTLAAGAAAVGGQASFSLQPSPPRTPAYFIFAAKQGQRLGGTVQLANVGSATGTALLYPVDATTADRGGVAYLARTRPRREVGRWLHLRYSRVRLKPREQALIPFTVTVPAEVRAGQHLGGIVAENLQTHTSKSRKGGFQIRIRELAIVAVQVTLPGPTKVGVQPFNLQATIRGKREILLLGLRNTGTLMVKPIGTLLVRSADHRLVQRTQLHIDTFLPQTTIEYPIFLHGRLPTGTYTASLTLHYGAHGTSRWHTTFKSTTK
jgi:WxL Interacting Protein, peptidoglycan binding domain